MKRMLSIPAFGIFVLLPLILGMKCVEYDPRFADPGTPPGDAAGGGDDGPVTPAQPCAEDRVAMLRVENFAYNISCGCREIEGKICTIATGTTVKWQFADSTSHNVTSVANSFGASADTSAGVYSKLFDAAGSFKYGCTIHPFDMSGYRIDVR